jgi:hypothetical protein
VCFEVSRSSTEKEIDESLSWCIYNFDLNYNRDKEMIDVSVATSCSDEDIKDIMTFHRWDEEMVSKGEKVRAAIGAAFKVIIENVPPSSDRSEALRKLREARMDCNSAITFSGKL